jgi:hypothetical protein
MSKIKTQNIELAKDCIKRFRYDRRKTENKSNPDYREVAKRLLKKTPSQLNYKITAYKELDTIQLAARMILDLGLVISVPTDVSNCACVHLYAFYRENSITEYEWSYVAVACLFMACKTEDHPRAINDIIIAAYNHWNKSYCKDIILKRRQLEQNIHELKSNLQKVQAAFIQHNPISQSNQNNNKESDTDSPKSIKSPGSSITNGTPNSCDFKSPASSGVFTATTPQPTTPDESGLNYPITHGVSPRSPGDYLNCYNRHNLYGGSHQQAQKIKNEINIKKSELLKLPIVRYLSPNNKKECVTPPDDFFKNTKPKIEQYEHDLLCSIGFCTIVSLPHILIVEAKGRFEQKYGESTKLKLDRIVYVAYDFATRVVSLFPVQEPRNKIASALIYLCGPFSHPVPYDKNSNKNPWWKEVYGANMTELELIDLAELICDAWISTKDYFTQMHCNRQQQIKKDSNNDRRKTIHNTGISNQNNIRSNIHKRNFSGNNKKYAMPESPNSISASPNNMFSPDSQFAESPCTNTSSPLSIDSSHSDMWYNNKPNNKSSNQHTSSIKNWCQNNTNNSSSHHDSQIRLSYGNKRPTTTKVINVKFDSSQHSGHGHGRNDNINISHLGINNSSNQQYQQRIDHQGHGLKQPITHSRKRKYNTTTKD